MTVAYETPCGGNPACSCEPFLRTSGFITLRRDKHLHTLPRRSFSGDGSLSFALKKLTLTSRYYRRSRTDHFECIFTGGAAQSARAFCLRKTKLPALVEFTAVLNASSLVARRRAHARFACAKQNYLRGEHRVFLFTIFFALIEKIRFCAILCEFQISLLPEYRYSERIVLWKT